MSVRKIEDIFEMKWGKSSGTKVWYLSQSKEAMTHSGSFQFLFKVSFKISAMGAIDFMKRRPKSYYLYFEHLSYIDSTNSYIY